MSQPISQSHRIEVLDIFRGFAVFGIFVVNIEIMNCAFPNQESFGSQWNRDIDLFIFRVQQLFFYSKFFPIFSFLFGLGISMQALKIGKKNSQGIHFFLRRMCFLFMVGLFHILFLWNGDVIHLYSILGLLILIILPLPNRWILIFSVVTLLFPFYEPIAFWFFKILNFSPETFLESYPSEKITQILRNGPYIDSIKFRVHEYLANIPLLFTYLAPLAFGMFLLGVFFGKNQIQKDLKNFISTTKKAMIILMIISNLYRVFFIFFLPNTSIYRDEVVRPILFKTMYLSDLYFGLFYLWLLAYLWYFTSMKKWLFPLQYPGRMALTNYLMQSVFGLIIFSSLGFQLYEKLSPPQTFLVAIIIFIIQLIYSKAWLNYFQFGPIEWLWRCFSYKKLIPNRKSAARV